MRTIVIGGGASGVMAAGILAKLTKTEVIILEKMPKAGLKLGITGKGRCNITNRSSLKNHLNNFGKNGRFLKDAYHSFFCEELLMFLEKIGIDVKVERGDRVYPVSEKATKVVKKLVEWANSQGVEFVLNQAVSEIFTNKGKIISVSSNQKTYYGENFIIATGGKSYPRTGSDGTFYNLISDLGHKINNLYPALVPLSVAPIIDIRLEGLKLKNINLTCYVNNKKKFTYFGDIQFFKGMLDGPLALKLSREIANLVGLQDNIEVVIDLKPTLDHDILDKRLIKELQSKQSIRNIMKTLLPWQLIDYCLEKTGIDQNLSGLEIDKLQRKKLRLFLKDKFKFSIAGTAGFEKAVVTQGGVSLKEVDPHTMSSKLYDNLYFIGEVLDLDANTGGYNLQAAFSTGHLAASKIAFEYNFKKSKEREMEK